MSLLTLIILLSIIKASYWAFIENLKWVLRSQDSQEFDRIVGSRDWHRFWSSDTLSVSESSANSFELVFLRTPFIQSVVLFPLVPFSTLFSLQLSRCWSTEFEIQELVLRWWPQSADCVMYAKAISKEHRNALLIATVLITRLPRCPRDQKVCRHRRTRAFTRTRPNGRWLASPSCKVLTLRTQFTRRGGHSAKELLPRVSGHVGARGIHTSFWHPLPSATLRPLWCF